MADKQKDQTNPDEITTISDIKIDSIGLEYREDESVEPSNPNTRSYFFPNDGQPFSCDAASLEEAEKKNTQYLQQRKESNA